MPVVPQRKNQTLPPDFAATLSELRRDKDVRLPLVLKVARLNGWNLEALAAPLGVTREYVRQLVAACEGTMTCPLPDVPPGPVRHTAPHKPPTPRLRVNPETAERLRTMQRVAATVNGGTPANAPEREVSRRLTAELAALADQGVSVKHLAKILGVTHFAVRSRLSRHGYRPPVPSQSHATYKGHAVYEGPDGRRMQDACHEGHPLSGDNLYVAPNGGRHCKACSRRRSRAYQARKRAASQATGDAA